MSQKDINYIGKLLKCNSKPTLWEDLKRELNYQGKIQFMYKQIIQSSPKSCKDGLIANFFPGPPLNEKTIKLLFEQNE